MISLHELFFGVVHSGTWAVNRYVETALLRHANLQIKIQYFFWVLFIPV